MDTRKLSIAVTGMNAGDSPAPGVAVVRCLRENPHFQGRVLGFAYDALESGILDRDLVDSAYLIPYPSAGCTALLDRLRTICTREKIDLLIPNLDSEILNFIAIEKDLKALGIRCLLPTEEQFKARLKANLPGFATKYGLSTPRTTIVDGPSSIRLENQHYPLVVKGVFYEAYVAYSRDAANQYVHKIAATWGYPILLQEYVAGEEFNVAAIGDGEGALVGAACMKKLVLTDKRKGWACVSIENRALLEFSEQIIRSLKWRGPIEIEAIQSKKDGRFYLIELNPRFPAWIYLAKAAGSNLPARLVQLAYEAEQVSSPSARPGVVFTNYTTNLVTELTKISGLFTDGELHYEKSL